MKRLLLALVAVVAMFAVAQAQVDTLTILHINDTHSHLLPWGPKDSGGNPTQGGMARLATLVGMTRMTEPNVMLFHSGDLFVGDFMFQEYLGVAELVIMKALQYDALELGNHEFDLYPSTLEFVLNQAGFPAQGFPVLCANLDMAADPVMTNFVKPYIIKEVGSLRIGIFGMATELTNQISNIAPLSMLPPLAEAPRWIDSLRIGHDCDMVILLSHLGVFEDQALASTVPGIDIILGGHSHTVLPQPMQVGGTLIVQAGEFVQYLGKLRIIEQGGQLQSWNYSLMNVDASVPSEPNLAGMISGLVAGVEADPRFGPVYTQPIAQAATNIYKPLGTGLVKDNALGNMVADAIRNATGADIAIQPEGFISQTIYAGPVTGDEIFQAVPYGFDQQTGYGLKLVTFQTDGMSLIGGLEFAAFNMPYLEDFFLHGSNINYAYNSNLTPGSRVDYASIFINGQPINPAGTYTVVVPEAVIPFFSQIPGFNVNNLTPTNLPVYTVVRDFMIAHSPVHYYAEGRVIDLALLSEPLLGLDALSDVVTVFRQNGSISNQFTSNMLERSLQVVRRTLEHNRFRPAGNQLAVFKLEVRLYQRFRFISRFSADKLCYLADKLKESLIPGLPKFDEFTEESNLPGNFALSQNYPNPFNPETKIDYTLPAGSDVNIEIYDILGQRVKTLVSGYQPAGEQTVIWNGRDDAGQKVSSGIYFYKMQAGNFVETKKMSLMK
jgi:5'-nucleotidase / UDP-sugar diphosphatase